MSEHLTSLRVLVWLLFAALFLLACESASKEEPLDCTAIPERPLEVNEIGTTGTPGIPRAHHDLAFDRDGYLAGFDGVTLVRSNRAFRMEVISSLLTMVEGMEYLPDGRLVVADINYGLISIGRDGSFVHMAPDILGFAVVPGPDGRLYVTDMDSRVYRIHLDTQEVQVWMDFDEFPELAEQLPRTLNFSLDYRKAYIGTFGEPVYEVDLDENLEPVSPPRLFVNLWDGAQWVDGMAVDVCGNLYFPIWPTHLLRVTPDGRVSSYHTFPEAKYGHGLKWGTGRDGWRDDALYMPQPYDDNTVVEVVTGVAGRPPWKGLDMDDPHELTCSSLPGSRPAMPQFALFGLFLLLFGRILKKRIS